MDKYDLIVIGGGCAGISAALSAKESGVSDILVIERDHVPGGVLNQCIHHGFGLAMFGRSLTGPEFAGRLIRRLDASGIKVLTGTAVTELSAGSVTASGACGCFRLQCRAVILACGCREKPIGALPVTGTRPSGIFTAGQAQRMINLGKMDIGDNVLILGSGDVGMIVARRLKLLGKNVIGVLEKGPSCGGLESNRISCLEQFGIPLFTRKTAVRIYGSARITGVDVLSLDSGITEHIPCRTLITSVGLIPELDLLDNLPEPKGIPEGIFLCGNCRIVHDTADSAADDGARIGVAAAGYIINGTPRAAIRSPLSPDNNAPGVMCSECPHQCLLTPTPHGLRGGLCGRYR